LENIEIGDDKNKDNKLSSDKPNENLEKTKEEVKNEPCYVCASGTVIPINLEFLQDVEKYIGDLEGVLTN
jgi:hypothetical protein